MKRPTCEIKGCENEALIFAFGKYICGDCLASFHEESNKQMIEKIEQCKKQKKD